MNIYISNLDRSIKSEDLNDIFSVHGKVLSAQVVNDVFTGLSRGFGYVEMENETAAQAAIDALNETELKSLKLSVHQAQPKEVHKGSYKVGSGVVNAYRFRKN